MVRVETGLAPSGRVIDPVQEISVAKFGDNLPMSCGPESGSLGRVDIFP